MYVAGQPIELGYDGGALTLAGLGERRRKLRATIQSIRALARLDLDVLGDDLKALGLRELRQRRALRLEPEPRPALADCAYPDVADNTNFQDAITPDNTVLP
jgi:hypothetical protein